jgi:hypothetical protein
MSRPVPPRIAGVAVAALVLAGCGEDPGIEEGLVPPKGTDTSSLVPLRDDMIRNMQNRSYLMKSEGGDRPAATPGGATESASAVGSKSSTDAEPATPPGSRPGLLPKSAPKGG